MKLLSVLVLTVSSICSTLCGGERVQGLSGLIHEFVVQETPQAEWSAYLKAAQDEKSRTGSSGFLDERLARCVAEAASGDDAKVKALGRCLALYKEFDAPIPEYVQQYAATRWSAIESVRAAGTTWSGLAHVLIGKSGSSSIPAPAVLTASSTSTIAKMPYCERCANGGCQTCGYYRH